MESGYRSFNTFNPLIKRFEYMNTMYIISEDYEIIEYTLVAKFFDIFTSDTTLNRGTALFRRRICPIDAQQQSECHHCSK